MKSPVWSLLLLAYLCSPGRSDCQGECLSCGLRLAQQQAFNTLVCLLECEGLVSPSLTWELCQQAEALPQYPLPPEGGAVSKRTGEEFALIPEDLQSDGELLYSAGMARFQQEGDLERRSAQFDSPQLGSTEEGEGLGLEDREEGVMDELQEGDDATPVDVSKRFGGFLKGRHGYRKLMGSVGRPLQKRYGGFIGIRKSARKWNNQKRVSQLLRQYLGISSRSGRFHSGPGARRPSPL
ncbi:prepronociceptin b [Osmerus eperlanus]|uniref:prepronociceptin b n=1 Tax=Osmerus eperlanus TaxID=29151 RepID=UPI002E12E5D0